MQAHFAKALRKARRKTGLTQAARADLAGLTQKDIAKIKAGRINPTVATMASLARVLRLEVGDLLRLADPPAR